MKKLLTAVLSLGLMAAFVGCEPAKKTEKTTTPTPEKAPGETPSKSTPTDGDAPKSG